MQCEPDSIDTLRRIVDGLSDAAMALKAGTSLAAHRVRHVNAAFCTLFGGSPERIVGGCLATVFEAPGTALQRLDRVLRDGRPGDFDLDLRLQDGAVGALRGQAVPVASCADGAVWLVTLRLLSDAEQATAASRAKTNFLAQMSHEIRTPLNAIIGFAEAIKCDLLGTGLPDRYREFAGDIHSSGLYLLDLINDILDLSKIEAGKFELNESEVDADAIAETVVRMLRTRAAAAGVDLVLEVGPAPRRIRADERAVKQVLSNLVSNALKFTAPGGAVTIGRSVDADGGLRLVVRDNGIGMRRDQIAQALEPFTRLQDPMGPPAEGTGLGLPLVKSLIELHGGDLELDSAPGVGTTAVVRIPAGRVVAGNAGRRAARR